MFGLFKKKDPICGMVEEKGKGFIKYDKWFCNERCLKDYERKMKSSKSCGCCH